jgi:hypothetical protein
VTIYKDGYQIDDGAVKPLDTPEGREFFSVLKDGYVPPSLSARDALNRPVPVNISLYDRKTENAPPPPKPTFKAFEGSGQRVCAQPASLPKPSAAPAKSFTLTPGRATMEVMVRGPGGRRGVVVHSDSPLEDLYAAVAAAGLASGSFELLAGVPPQKLPRGGGLVAATEAKGSVVMVRQL